MQPRTKHVLKFFALLLLQLTVSLAAISIYWHKFDLPDRILLEHAAVVFLIYLILSIGWMLILSVGFVRRHKTCRYFPAIFWACAALFLYASYLLAFSGKLYTNQVYTFSMVFAYIPNAHVFMQSLSIRYSYLFFLLLFIPGCIVAWHLWFAGVIFDGLVSVREILLDRHSTPISLAVAALVFGTGFCTGALVFNDQNVAFMMYKDEEPVVSACQEKPLHQNLYFARNIENPQIRAQYPRNTRFEKLNVVVIVVDALRPDHLGLYGYSRNTTPFLDQLFRDGSLRKVDRSFANSAGSFAGVLTILRGRHWAEMGRNDFALHDLLKDQGYRINFLISGNHRSFYNLKNFYGNSIDFYFDGADTKDYAVDDDRLIFEAFRQIPPAKNNPSFFYIHLSSAHASGYRLPEFRIYRPYQHYWMVPSAYINNYDNGITQADFCIGKIFQLLKEKGYLQQSIVVITADHGESLGERGYFSHSHHVYTEEILIPMLIYDADRSISYQGLNLSTQTDVAPTIVDRLGLPVPESWSGNSLLKKERNPYSIHYSTFWTAVIHHHQGRLHKFLYNAKAERQEAYDLTDDLYEKHNIIDQLNPEYVQQLKNILQRKN